MAWTHKYSDEEEKLEHYRTLHDDIADDLFNEIIKKNLNTLDDVLRWITETVDASEVSFKPLWAKRFLAYWNESESGDCLCRAREVLDEKVRESLRNRLEFITQVLEGI